MSSSLYVALSAQMAMDRRMTTIANNVANMNTPGFRAEQVRFETVMSQTGGHSVAYSSAGESYTSLTAGQVSYTANPLDVAVEGKGWFAIQTPSGIAYTRDGRMRMAPEGQLRSVNNYPVLDAGGAPLAIDPSGGEVRIGSDGSMTQGGKPIGSVGVFTIPHGAGLKRFDNATVIPDRPATLVQDFTANKVRQGYVEGANVDPVMEMARLITVQRAFEMAAAAVSQNEDATSSAIRQLGPS
ncbi:MAG: flagellar basal-body rod protein FlgF [Azorhizobium sp. 12-66-6]|nr:MAG: flagellar basal-body rod protein FlgF [Azorhizobium sp. 12-66-6]